MEPVCKLRAGAPGEACSKTSREQFSRQVGWSEIVGCLLLADAGWCSWPRTAPHRGLGRQKSRVDGSASSPLGAAFQGEQ